MTFELTRELIDEVKAAVAARDETFLTATFGPLHAVDVSGILYELDTEESKYVMTLLDREVGAEILSNLEPEVRRRFLRHFEPAEVGEYIHHLDSDDAADILNEQPVKVREEVIAHIEDEKTAQDVLELLRYDEDCAGGLMAKELIKVNINWDVNACIEEIRRQAEEVEKIYSMYVVDDQDKLLGRVALKKLILARAGKRVADLYEPGVIAVESFLHEEEVADLMRRYDLEAVPVVNIKGKLLGRITIDDIVDVITEQAERDQQAMAGITGEIEDDSVWQLARSRLPWLLIGMGGGLLGAQFIGFFERDIALIPAMAFFIPLITATGGNVGIQSSTVVVQSLANRQALGRGYFKRFLKTISVALINAVVISGVVFGVSILSGETPRLSLVVSIALFSVVMLASFTGSVTPLVLDRFGVNPALASGPFITTANDLIGLAVYFSVAHVLYGL